MNEVNAQALHVVAQELATTLNDARASLEASLEHPGDPAPLTHIAELLRQARGVLKVAEVYGGALLAEEMEHTARFLVKGADARQQADGLDALMRSVVQLPTYLERVLGGGRDLALVLLPLLNDLRSVRGASLLSEGTLLSLNLTSEQKPRPRPVTEAPGPTLPQLARRLRPRFQVALLGLIRGDKSLPHVDALIDVAGQIEAGATTAPVFQLWWVSGALLEGLKEGGVEDNASVKRLLGQADRELRRIYELGEDLYSQKPPLDLLNNMLFYIARASSNGTRVEAVRTSFRLNEMLPVDEVVGQEQDSLSGPSVKLMHTVAAAIREDLGRVKDALDLFTRQGGRPEELEPQVELLKKISDTLAVLGLGSLREQVQGEIGRLAALVSRSVPAEREALIGIAAALISVEDSLDDSLVRLIMPPGAPLAGAIQDPEFRQVAQAVLRECGVNLARIKELVAQALEPGADVAGLDSVAGLTRGVAAGLLMLGKSRAMEVMTRIGHHVTESLLPGDGQLSAQAIDRLADAVVSLEYYMETLQAGRGDPLYMLDNAERCLAAIDTPEAEPAIEEAAPEAEAKTSLEPKIKPLPLPVDQADADRTVILKLTRGMPAVTGWREAPGYVEPKPEPGQEQKPAAEEVAPAVPAESRLDLEMLEVFIEEAREEVEVVQGLFPMWADNPADRESLTRVRRAFHTLKGSGRMVGAMALGEFAWSIENLLNRIIDGTRERTPAAMKVLREAVDVLPGLVDALERHDSAGSGADSLAARAHAIAEGREVAAIAEPEPGEEPEQEPAASHEPTLMTATLDEATMIRMLESVPPAEGEVPAREAMVEVQAGPEEPAEEAAPEAEAEPEAPADEVAAEAEAEPEAPVEEAAAEAQAGPQEPVEEAAPETVAEEEAEATPQGRGEEAEEPEIEAEPYAAMDPSLQDIFRKEVQLHLDIVRDFLRKVWVTPGPHYVTDDLYRACHTLRGASRTAESSECIRLADPLHRWLRRLFDADRAFDEDGLATLADTVAAFEDIVESAVGGLDYLPTLEGLIARLKALDLALEQALAAEPEEAQAAAEQPAVTEEPAATEEPGEAAEAAAGETPLSIEHLIPQISVETQTPRARLGAGFDRLLPETPEEKAVGGEMPYGPDAGLPEQAGVDEAEAPGEEPTAEATREPETAGPAEEEATAEEQQWPPAVEDVVASEVEVSTPREGPQPEIAAEAEPQAAQKPGEIDLEEVARTDAGKSHEYDADIAAIFSEEATELLEAADGSLGALRAERGNGERIVELQRALHTLKGGARMAGIAAMGDLSHELETLLTQVSVSAAPLDERTFEVLQASLDELNRMRDFVNAGRAVRPARDLVTRIHMVARGTTPEPTIEAPAEVEAPAPIEAPQAEAVPGEEPVAGEIEQPQALEPAQPVPEEAATDSGVEAAAVAEKTPVLPGREGGAERAEMARVDADLLDTMLNNAGEVSIFRARLEQQLSSVDFNLAELARVVQRLKEQLRKLEIETEAQILHRHVDSTPRRTDFDPLELDRYSTIQQYSRALGETAADVASIQGLLGSLTREAQNLLTQQGRIVSDLQNSLMRTRMVPFQRHVQRLTRIVRQAASELGKRADLTVTGAAGELDRQVLDRMLPPFEHLVRNAVVHGIESPEERVKVGKPEAGRIELSLRREGSEVVIVVADDGAGINLRAVREKAISLGITSPKQDLSDEQATQLILEPGFSTAGKVTQSAGRGVGMDVVVTEIKKLGGALFIDSEEGRGTRFTVRLPFTLAISQALVVRSGDEFFALPLPTVEGVVRVPAAEVERQLVADTAAFEYGGQQYRFQHLSTFVGGEAAAPAEHDPAVPVILIRAGEHSTGIVTDELIGSREIVVKSVGPQIAGIRGISGATILGDGRICIILDVGALVRSEWRARPQPEKSAREREDTRLFALVVDDSITVRRVTQRLLERNGMRVMTAKDGLDAIAVLQDHVPDVILLDIEMPRMDGYEVASHVRNDPRLQDVPIVMITSRVGEKHRARAIELGVNDYLGKPYQEAQLLQALEPLLQRRRAS